MSHGADQNIILAVDELLLFVIGFCAVNASLRGVEPGLAERNRRELRAVRAAPEQARLLGTQ